MILSVTSLEVTALRMQIDEVKKTSEKDLKALENVGSIIQDVAELKLLVLDLPPKLGEKLAEISSNESNSSAPINVTQERSQSEEEPSNSPADDVETTSYSEIVNRNTSEVSTSKMNGNQSRNSDGNWQTVNNRRRSKSSRKNSTAQKHHSDPAYKKKTSRRNISGKRTSEVGLQAAPRILDVFLGGCALDTTPQHIMDYCKKYDINPKECEFLTSKSKHHKCYKISVFSIDRDTLLDADFWPIGTFVGKYYKPKVSINES